MIGFKILFANLYDLILLIAIWFVFAIPFVLWQGKSFEDNSIMVFAFQVYILGITYIYLTYFWTQAGQTPGLRTWKLRIVNEDNSAITRYNANLRFIFTIIFFLIGWIGLFLPKNQLLQDRLAKTKIVIVEYNQ